MHHGTLGPERRKVIADAAALLQGERRLLEVLEYAAHVVRNAAHDETVEQRHAAVGPGAGENASGRDELEIRKRLGEAAGPQRLVLFRPRQGHGDPLPAILDGFVHRVPGFRLEAVFGVPDTLGYGGSLRHFPEPKPRPQR